MILLLPGYLLNMCAHTGKGKQRLTSPPIKPSQVIPPGMNEEQTGAWTKKYNNDMTQFFADQARYEAEVRARLQCSIPILQCCF